MTSADDVLAGVDLSGSHVVVTGATAGLGHEAARSMAAAGATVTLVGRSAWRHRPPIDVLQNRAGVVLAPEGRAPAPDRRGSDRVPLLAGARHRRRRPRRPGPGAARGPRLRRPPRHGDDRAPPAQHARAAGLAEAAERSKERNAGRGPTITSVEEGAGTQVWASVEPSLVDHAGAYLADCRLGELGGNPSGHGFLPHLLDDGTAERPWSRREELVGQRFTT